MVEIAIALGIFSFVLISLLGLMSVGLNSSQSSSRGLAMSAIASRVIEDIRTNSYQTLSGDTFYFDKSGTLTNELGAIYTCSLEVLSNSTPMQGMSSQSKRIRVSFFQQGSTQAAEVFETVLAAY